GPKMSRHTNAALAGYSAPLGASSTDGYLGGSHAVAGTAVTRKRLSPITPATNRMRPPGCARSPGVNAPEVRHLPRSLAALSQEAEKNRRGQQKRLRAADPRPVPPTPPPLRASRASRSRRVSREC